MKLFLDTANLDEIKEALEWGVISGVTTNPTLVVREQLPFVEIVKNIADLVPGPVNAEVISTESAGMVSEAETLAALAPNVVVKIPMTIEGLKAVRILHGAKISTNVTLVFSANQGLLASLAGADFVSPFVGRLDDVGNEGMQVVHDLVEIYSYYDLATEIIAASIRHPAHVIEAARAGANIATVPFDVLKQMVRHPLTDKGIDRFLADWGNVKAGFDRG